MIIFFLTGLAFAQEAEASAQPIGGLPMTCQLKGTVGPKFREIIKQSDLHVKNAKLPRLCGEFHVWRETLKGKTNVCARIEGSYIVSVCREVGSDPSQVELVIKPPGECLEEKSRALWLWTWLVEQTCTDDKSGNSLSTRQG